MQNNCGFKDCSPSNIRILVVDDTEANRYPVVRYLQRAGFEVWQAQTGEEGLRLAAQKPDLIILDVRLPDMLGFDVCRLLKNNPQTASIPVLHISATFRLSGDRVKGLESGADGYLTGPVEPDELVANVKVLLRLKETQENLRRINEKLCSVLTSVAEAHFSLDQSWKFTAVNRAAEELIFQRPAQELMGKVIWDEFPETRGLECYERLQVAVRQQQPVHFEGTLGRADKIFETHAYPRGQEVEVYLRDITERKLAQKALEERERDLQRLNSKLEEEVRRRTAKLQETIHELEALTYSITHDMRAPLRAMQGFSRMVLNDYGPKLDDEAADLLNRIVNAATRLDQLILEVLSYSNIARSTFSAAPVDLHTLVSDIIREYPGLQAPQVMVVLKSKLPKVMGSLALLTQCFSNLLTNAVKFVAPGTTPHIEISADQIDNVVRVWVRDNGIGIAPEHHAQIFKMFERLHASHEYSGTGIGLAIAQKAVERMGGRIGVESQPGRGSAFWVELPAT